MFVNLDRISNQPLTLNVLGHMIKSPTFPKSFWTHTTLYVVDKVFYPSYL
jgi:hypothetical protein